MKAPIIVLFLFHFLAIEAQVADFPSTSVRPIWGIRYKLDLGGFRDEVIGILKDTQICGKNYGFLIGAPLDFSYTVDMGFIRTEGKKVWVKKDARCSSKEYLLYDFDMKKGDTSYCLYYLNNPRADSTKYWVNSIDTIINQGKPIKRMKMGYIYNPPCGAANNPCKTFELVWLEGIGRTWNPFDFHFCTDWYFCQFDLTLNCLQTSSGLQYLNPIITSCPSTTTSISNTEIAKIGIVSNPVSTILHLKNSNQFIGNQVFILDLLGRVIKKEKLDMSQELNVSDLLNGLYLLKIVSNGQSQTAKFEVFR